jgi:cardiolipin synthase
MFQMSASHWLILLLVSAVAVTTAVHAMLFKRDPRSAFAWVAVCLLFPVAGPVLYAFFGINRIRTRAKKLGEERSFKLELDESRTARLSPFEVTCESLPDECQNIARTADAVTRHPLVSGNVISPLSDGESAYPEMLQAIDSAQNFVLLSTFIFQRDESGMRFAEALGGAVGRGVDVRVIVDGVGEFYGLPRRVGNVLKQRGVRLARFLPPKLIPPTLYINLRNHRKLLIVDGRIGFTGGMNIADRHLAQSPEPPARARDIHFRFEGPVVGQLEDTFMDDWHFCTGDDSAPGVPYDWSRSETRSRATAVCRAIAEGPHEDFNTLATILIGAISSARRRVVIVTPYFLPSQEMIGALQSAALRGAGVTIIMPEKNNLPYVHWATRKMLWEMIEYGVHTYYQPPPFAHTKLFVIDDFYAQVGSANFDPRSLRLNFELNVEVFDRGLVQRLADYTESIQRRSRKITLDELDGRSLPVRTRDALAWLFSPYL